MWFVRGQSLMGPLFSSSPGNSTPPQDSPPPPCTISLVAWDVDRGGGNAGVHGRSHLAHSGHILNQFLRSSPQLPTVAMHRARERKVHAPDMDMEDTKNGTAKDL